MYRYVYVRGTIHSTIGQRALGLPFSLSMYYVPPVHVLRYRLNQTHQTSTTSQTPSTPYHLTTKKTITTHHSTLNAQDKCSNTHTLFAALSNSMIWYATGFYILLLSLSCLLLKLLFSCWANALDGSRDGSDRWGWPLPFTVFQHNNPLPLNATKMCFHYSRKQTLEKCE